MSEPAKPNDGDVNSDSLADLIRRAVAFRDARDWTQFHTTKELAISLSVESNELLQLLQWWRPDELESQVEKERSKIVDELADVMFSVLLMADHLKIDLGKAFLSKLEKTGAKYPVEKARGSARKYTDLE